MRAMASSFMRFLDHTQIDAPDSALLLWTSDQLVAETTTWQYTQHSQEADIYVLSGIQTHNLSRRAAADNRLRKRGHWDRRTYDYYQLTYYWRK